jgi:oligoendopeptidase F
MVPGDEQARDAYLHFLTMGGHGYPLDLLRDAGVDLTLPAAVETTFKTLDSYVDQLEKLVG